MPKSKKSKKKKDDDDNWSPRPSSQTQASSYNEECVIHCTKTNEKLTELPSMSSWEKLLEATRVRGDETLLKIAESNINNELPSLKYHMKCRPVFTNSDTLNTIMKKRKVCTFYFDLIDLEQVSLT